MSGVDESLVYLHELELPPPLPPVTPPRQDTSEDAALFAEFAGTFGTVLLRLLHRIENLEREVEHLKALHGG